MIHHLALDSTSVVGDQAGQLNALNGLGDIHWEQGRHEQATDLGWVSAGSDLPGHLTDSASGSRA